MTDFIDFTTLQRPASPNTALVAPAGLCQAAETDEDAPLFDASPDELFDRIVKRIEADRKWTPKSIDADTRRLSFVASTSLLRFKDDVDIQVLPIESGQGATLAIYSRSRVGYSDLGANLKRIKKLLKDIA